MGKAVLEQRHLVSDLLAVSRFNHACHKHLHAGNLSSMPVMSVKKELKVNSFYFDQPHAQSLNIHPNWRT